MQSLKTNIEMIKKIMVDIQNRNILSSAFYSVTYINESRNNGFLT